ncbi:hypothetical protein A5724_24490 [Mycobacterium sp. ACS1612]|uniref:hypothetical protein n=1 Tax=Mycobacterium sp. ACS1612 TaxID=1834117 RepID=UPI000800D28C|nr:hypothetical protein [Mycobacterium sp. ACS1612]OBF30370.1 hypothetical protein A5724_24490 [Mycobacterium sp. ACS1612]
MRTLEADEAADAMRWLCGDTWPPESGYTGFDPIGPWPAAAWVLNAIYERDDMPANLTYHELRQQAIAAGLQEAAIGGGLGFAEKPPPPWRRLTWCELGAREGFGCWAVNADWEDPGVIPAAAHPAIGPTGQSSWPVSILPPTEGSLDAESLDGVIAVLAEHTSAHAVADCGFYYGVVAFMPEDATVFAGDLRELSTLARIHTLTPNNIWPADHSWLIYTDYDLNATRVSGSPELVDALRGHRDLDTIRVRFDRPGTST